MLGWHFECGTLTRSPHPKLAPCKGEGVPRYFTVKVILSDITGGSCGTCR